MIPWLTKGVIVLHHNGVSLLSMAPYSCGVAREKGLFAAVLTTVQLNNLTRCNVGLERALLEQE